MLCCLRKTQTAGGGRNQKEFALKTVGVDLHKDSMTLVVLDDQGSLVERDRLPTQCRNPIQDWFASRGPPSQVAVESVGFDQWF